MTRGWYDDIYGDILTEWRVYVMDNANEDEGDVDEDELLEDFKNSDINVNFNVENLNAIELVEIQKYLLDNGANYQYLFDLEEIEKLVVEKVLEEFEG
jgi:predicted transcriptional regulator